MAPKKGKKGKKEVLPDPSTLPNGPHNYYVGRWSFFQSIESVEAISESLVAEHTGEDRELAPLPRTNVLILPPTGTKEELQEIHDEDQDDMTDVRVVDNMQIEGVSRRALHASNALMKMWTRPDPPPEPEPVVKEKRSRSRSGSKSKGKGSKSKKKKGSVAAVEEPVPLEEMPAVEVGADGQPLDSAPLPVEEVVVEAPPPPPPSAEEYEDDGIDGVVTIYGSTFTSRHAQIHGEVRILGHLPQIVVHPQLPKLPQHMEEALQAEKAKKEGKKGKAARAKAPKAPKGKRGKKVKLTQEQLEEIERQKAEEEALYLQQTEEAIALAKEQEDYIMTFAHPDRWAKVVVSNLTFTGPVIVVRAHVTFQNCRFTSCHPTKPQLRASQYCQVKCIKCSFDAPIRCALYALPAAQVTVTKCLFTGVATQELMTMEGTFIIPKEALPDAEPVEEAEMEDDGAEHKAPSGDLVMMPAVKAVSSAVQSLRASSVGVETDNAKLSVSDCRFLFLGIAALFRGRDELAARTAKGRKTAANFDADMSLIRCHIHQIFNTAVLVEKNANRVFLQRNVVSDCSYYGLDCKSGCKNVRIHQNVFGIGAVVRIGSNVHPSFMHNDLHSIPIDENNYQNPCMETKY